MISLVFSRDRALQLHAFVRSYRDHVTPAGQLHVLYRATTERHALAYEAMFVDLGLPWVFPHKQSASFRDDLLAMLPSSGQVACFVDDMVFIRPWPVQDAEAGLSLRLGLNLTRNYTTSDLPQTLPPFLPIGESLVTWRWVEGELAWRYPLSLDGHVFDLAELRSMVESVEFHSPNTLEAALQQFVPRFLERRGVCYRESRVVNVPWNRVQDDWDNRCSSIASVLDMLGHLEHGKQIDLHALYGVLNESVHQEFPLVLESRQ